MSSLPGARLLLIDPSDAAAQTRFWAWGSAWRGFLERPILGWGPENFSTVFDKHFDARFFVPGKATETWFDRFRGKRTTFVVALVLQILLALIINWLSVKLF